MNKTGLTEERIKEIVREEVGKQIQEYFANLPIFKPIPHQEVNQKVTSTPCSRK